MFSTLFLVEYTIMNPLIIKKQIYTESAIEEEKITKVCLSIHSIQACAVVETNHHKSRNSSHNLNGV